MEWYLLKSVICLGIFFLFYKLLLEREGIHTVKRLYLVAGLLLSFIIPALTFTEYSTMIPFADPMVASIGVFPFPLEDPLPQTETTWIPIVLWVLYGLGVLFFGVRFARNLSKLLHKISRNPQRKEKQAIHVLLRPQTTPHTFFNYIFFQQDAYEQDRIPKEVIDHETTHAKQWHSMEILALELLQVVIWFHPLLYFYKKSVQLNHEFLADRSVLNHGADPVAYQRILLAFSSNAHTPVLAHSINYSSIKKRFNVMKTQSNSATWLRTFLILPLIAFMVYGFSNRETVFVPTPETEMTALQQTSATRAEMKEYNQLAKKYNAMPSDDRTISMAELKRMKFIYQKMSSKQRLDAEPFPFPVPPPPPPAPEAPKAGNPVAPTPPPPPPAPDPVKTIKQLSQNNASFYWGPHPITPQEAIDAVRKNPTILIEVDNSYPMRPVVKLQSC